MKSVPAVVENDLGLLDVKRINGPKNEKPASMSEKELGAYASLLQKTKSLHGRTY